MYHCVSINKMFSVMDKSFKKNTFVEEKLSYSMIIILNLYLRRLSYHFSYLTIIQNTQASNSFKR